MLQNSSGISHIGCSTWSVPSLCGQNNCKSDLATFTTFSASKNTWRRRLYSAYCSVVNVFMLLVILIDVIGHRFGDFLLDLRLVGPFVVDGPFKVPTTPNTQR